MTTFFDSPLIFHRPLISPNRLTVFAALSCMLIIASCGSETGSTSGNGRLATLELDATFPEAFSYLSGVRKLSDGRILAADPIGQVLLRLDLDAGTADTLGRQGPGPQEYDGPDQVFPLPGDSTLLIDLSNGRLTVIDITKSTPDTKNSLRQ